MKKLLSIMLVACLVFIVACAPAGGDPSGQEAAPPIPGVPTPGVPTPGTAPPEGAQLADHIYICVGGGGLVVINPFLPAGNTGAGQWTFRITHDRLVYDLGDGNYGPMLATSWHTDDGQTYVFNLRDDVYFHNGDKFNAESVAGTIRVAQEHVGSVGGERWRMVESWNIPSPYTIEITLSSVHIDFLFDISAPPAGIINYAAFRADPEEGVWVGTGPFRITDFSTGDFVTVERFDGYWGDPPPTRVLTLRYIPEIATRLVMLQNREIHISLGISSDDLPLLEGNPDYQIFSVAMNAPNVLGFNLNDPIVGDLNFRRAVFHALYLPDVAMAAAGTGAVAPEDGNVWGLETAYRVQTIPPWEHNLEIARQYLEASPYNGETLEIAAGIITQIRASEMVQLQLRQIGIDIHINVMDMGAWTSYVAYGSQDFQMHVNGMTFPLSAVAAATNAYLPGSGLNRSNFNRPFATELIESGRVELDDDARRSIFEELQHYIAEDPPFINLFWRVFGHAAVAELGGMEFHPDTFRNNFRNIYMLAG